MSVFLKGLMSDVKILTRTVVKIIFFILHSTAMANFRLLNFVDRHCLATIVRLTTAAGYERLYRVPYRPLDILYKLVLPCQPMANLVNAFVSYCIYNYEYIEMFSCSHIRNNEIVSSYTCCRIPVVENLL